MDDLTKLKLNREFSEEEAIVAKRHKMDHVDMILLRHVAANPKITNGQLGDMLNYRADTIGIRRNRQHFIKALRELSATTSDLIKIAKKEAIARARKIMEEGKEENATKVALKLLDQELSPKQSVEHNHNLTFTTQVNESGGLIQTVAKSLPKGDEQPSEIIDINDGDTSE